MDDLEQIRTLFLLQRPSSAPISDCLMVWILVGVFVLCRLFRQFIIVEMLFYPTITTTKRRVTLGPPPPLYHSFRPQVFTLKGV